jgi:UDP-N-acetylglucosamine 4,6-dehydratase
MYENKTLLITGGTGSFGNAVLNEFINSDLKEIRILSRDEKKQDSMRKHYNNKKLRFYLGDVRDFSSINNSIRGCNYVFHAAALKQVPSCEFHPLEAFKTNVIGTENVIQSCFDNKIEKVVCLSTDKAVYPINAMGISKAMMEKLVIAKSLQSDSTIACITRYGNVMGSRGSVIPLFLDQIKKKKPLTLTDPNMTRFMMTLNDAVKLVIKAFEVGDRGEIFIQKSPAATMSSLAKAMIELYGNNNYPIQVIGTRCGEKLHETILSREETLQAEEQEGFIKVKNRIDELNPNKYINMGESNLTKAKDFTSQNAEMLNISALKELICKVYKYDTNINY